MQTITVNQEFLTSKDCTSEILTDIATRHCKMESEQATKLLKQGKLIGAVRKYLQDPNNGYDEAFKEGNLQLDIAALPDPAPQAKPRKASAELKGAYVVVRQGVKCTDDTDPGKNTIWKELWASKSFEEYFQKAPAKAVTRTGRVITASSEARWALKSGWIKPVEQQTQGQ